MLVLTILTFFYTVLNLCLLAKSEIAELLEKYEIIIIILKGFCLIKNCAYGSILL